MQLFILIFGLAIIVKSADVLVDSSSKIAHNYGISTFIIGISVVAFGTSAPELAVGIVSGINRANVLTLGNIVGSYMANITLIIGVSAIIIPLQVKKNVIVKELPILIFIVIILGIMMFNDGHLSRLEGIILLCGFALFIYNIYLDMKKSVDITAYTREEDLGLKPKMSTGRKAGVTRLWIYSLVSMLGLFVGGNLTVNSSTKLAISLGLSETIIGLTVVSIATTIPELMASVIAARKNEAEIVLGNSIGSNVFNILLVLGASTTITPIPVESELLFDLIFMIIVSILVLSISLIKRRFNRSTGIFLILIYILYLTLKVGAALV